MKDKSNVIPFHQTWDEPNAKRKHAVVSWLTHLRDTKVLAAGEELTEAKLRAYLFELRDVPLEQLQRAFDRASRECKYFPKPFEILELCSDVDAHARACEKLRARYDRAYANGYQPPQLRGAGSQ